MPRKSKSKLWYCKGMRYNRTKRKAANQFMLDKEIETFGTGENLTTGQLPSRQFRWNKTETLMLLSLCQRFRTHRDITKHQIDFYRKISRAMKKNGYKFNPTQCESKLKTLLRRYEQIKNQIQTEQTHKKWEYYEAMDDFVNASPIITSEIGSSTLSQEPQIHESIEMPKSLKTSKYNEDEWTKNETLMLLCLCQKNRNAMYTKFTSDFFEEIACAMKNNGYKFSSEECCNRFYELSRRYHQNKNHNNDTKWEYYKIMEEFYLVNLSEVDSNGSNVDVMEPLNIKLEIDEIPVDEMMKTLENLKKEDDDKGALQLEVFENCHAENMEENEPQKIKSEIDDSPTREVLERLETLQKDDDERETHRLNILKKRHAENTELLQALVEKLH